jgi:DNA-binding NarL/FixJ family response regulator
MLEAAQGHHLQAVRLAGAASARRTAAGATLSQASQAKVDASLAQSRQMLGQTATDAWREGEAWSLTEAIAAAISTADAGQPSVLVPMAEHPPSTGLTAREEDVAALIAQGLTNRQIGERLVITEGTVATHVVHIFAKLGFNSRAQVAVWAADRNLRPATSA